MQRTRYPERRRTTRLSLEIPLTIRCRLHEGETIDLKASTYSVSANGALVQVCLWAASNKTNTRAKWLMHATVVHIPLLLGLMVYDKLPR